MPLECLVCSLWHCTPIIHAPRHLVCLSVAEVTGWGLLTPIHFAWKLKIFPCHEKCSIDYLAVRIPCCLMQDYVSSFRHSHHVSLWPLAQDLVPIFHSTGSLWCCHRRELLWAELAGWKTLTLAWAWSSWSSRIYPARFCRPIPIIDSKVAWRTVFLPELFRGGAAPLLNSRASPLTLDKVICFYSVRPQTATPSAQPKLLVPKTGKFTL